MKGRCCEFSKTDIAVGHDQSSLERWRPDPDSFDYLGFPTGRGNFPSENSSRNRLVIVPFPPDFGDPSGFVNIIGRNRMSLFLSLFLKHIRISVAIAISAL